MFYGICFSEYFHLENFTIRQIFFRQCVHAMNSPNFPAAKVSLHTVYQQIKWQPTLPSIWYVNIEGFAELVTYSAVIRTFDQLNFGSVETDRQITNFIILRQHSQLHSTLRSVTWTAVNSCKLHQSSSSRLLCKVLCRHRKLSEVMKILNNEKWSNFSFRCAGFGERGIYTLTMDTWTAVRRPESIRWCMPSSDSCLRLTWGWLDNNSDKP